MKQLSNEYIGLELSHATMRSEDLIPTFMSFLHSVENECVIEKEAQQIQEDVDKLEMEEYEGYSGPYYKDPEEASYILNEDIWDLLNAIAPDHTSFGSHEGDGSLYGFWTNDDNLWDWVETQTYAALGRPLDFEEFRDIMQDVLDKLEYHNR